MKSYNSEALRGHPMTDAEFQEEMADIGIHIPDSYLYTPKINPFVIDAVHKDQAVGLQSVMNPSTQKNFTEKEAKVEADKLRDFAYKNIETLMKQ